MQRALLQYFDPKNHWIVVEALREAGRPDLIGTGPHCPGPSPAGRSNPRAGYEAERGREIGMEPQKGLPSAAEKPRRKTKKNNPCRCGGCPVPIGPAVWDLLRPAGLGKAIPHSGPRGYCVAGRWVSIPVPCAGCGQGRCTVAGMRGAFHAGGRRYGGSGRECVPVFGEKPDYIPGLCSQHPPGQGSISAGWRMCWRRLPSGPYLSPRLPEEYLPDSVAYRNTEQVLQQGTYCTPLSCRGRDVCFRECGSPGARPGGAA